MLNLSEQSDNRLIPAVNVNILYLLHSFLACYRDCFKWKETRGQKESTQQEVQKGWTESLKGVIVLNVMSSYTEDKVGLNIKGCGWQPTAA